MSVSTIKEAIVAIKSGKMVILVDDEDRENEGDLCMAAQFVTPEAINFMARYGRGLICLTLTEETAEQLRLIPMVRDNRSCFGTAFTVSIEAKQGVTTGISAADRATTIHAAVADGGWRALEFDRHRHLDPLVLGDALEIDVQHLDPQVVVLDFLDHGGFRLAVEPQVDDPGVVPQGGIDILLAERDRGLLEEVRPADVAAFADQRVRGGAEHGTEAR